jgi:holo-[acyl-carrier protein] synthase
MAVYCGTDLIRISRITRAVERLGTRFLQRIYHETELFGCGWPDYPRMNSLAARFAAKEAVAKALGTGIGPLGIQWTDIRVTVQSTQTDAKISGQPSIQLLGRAADRYNELNGESISISMSHDGDLALAFCVFSTSQERTDTACCRTSSDKN